MRPRGTRVLASETGQDLIEYVGLIAIVAILIGGVLAAAPGLGRTVSHGLSCAVHSVLDSGTPCTQKKYAVSTSQSALRPSWAKPSARAAQAAEWRRTLAKASHTKVDPTTTVTPCLDSTPAQPVPGAKPTQLNPFSQMSPADQAAAQRVQAYFASPSAPGGRQRDPSGKTLPQNLGCALSGGGADESHGQAWTPGSGLASNAREAYALNQAVAHGQLPPEPANWDRMNSRQRNAFECQAAQDFGALSCPVSKASVDQAVLMPYLTTTKKKGPSFLDKAISVVSVVGSGLQQVVAPEFDLADGEALEAGDTKAGEIIAGGGGTEVTEAATISSAEEGAANQVADHTASEETQILRAQQRLSNADNPGEEASKEEDAAAACGGQSFTPDTLVLLADGRSVPISELRVGVRVLAVDPGGGARGQPVQAVWARPEHGLLDVSVRGADGSVAVVHTTVDHPFWDRSTGRWTDAADLGVGDRLATPAGAGALVSSTTPVHGKAVMWDLTVAQDHDFFVVVDDSRVLVHNTDPNCGPQDESGVPATTGHVDLSEATTVRGKFPSKAEPGQVLVRRDPLTGEPTNYQEYGPDGLPTKRVDLTGSAHGGVETPHVHEYGRNTNPKTGEKFVNPRPVRPAKPNEVP